MLETTGHNTTGRGERLSAALLFSLEVHLLMVAVLIPVLIPKPPSDELLELACPHLCVEDESEEPIAVDLTIIREVLAESVPEVPAQEPPPRPENHSEPEEEPEIPLEPLPQQYYMVDIDVVEEQIPLEDTPYLAPVNSRTDEEVQAEETQDFASAGESERTATEPEPESEEQADRPTEEPDEPLVAVAEEIADDDAENEIDEADQIVARTEPPSTPNQPERTEGDRLDLSRFQPTMMTYRQSRVAVEDRRQRERIARQMRYLGYLHHDDQAEWERMRASLENMLPEVRSGTETRLNARRHAYAEYISYMHRRIHALWARGYLMSLPWDPSDPRSDPNLQATLEIVIASSGEVERVNIVRTSGITSYDGEAIGIVHRIGPLRPPPSVILSDNGNAYVHWNFWRDQRQCGTFGASVHAVHSDQAH